jgi:hypothetical protein
MTVPQHHLPEPVFVTLTPLDPRGPRVLPPYSGPRVGGGPAGGDRPTGPRAPAPVESGAAPPPDTVSDLPAFGLPVGPRLGDGRAWVSPRPALPSRVADALYGTPEDRDSVAMRRLRAMIDTVNLVIDSMQRERQLPTWTTEVAGRKFGIDSQYIHIAGIRIPTLALAMLPLGLPQGNFDQMTRARHLQDLREDLLHSARRTETLNDFRRYVRELRERKDAERERERKQERKAEARADTAKAMP